MKFLKSILLAMLMIEGCGTVFVPTTDNAEESIEKLRALVEAGDIKALNNLANKYWDGNGVTQNYVEALKWFNLAAARGNATAQTVLGVMHSQGFGTLKDYQEALKWFRVVAEQGDDLGQLALE